MKPIHPSPPNSPVAIELARSFVCAVVVLCLVSVAFETSVHADDSVPEEQEELQLEAIAGELATTDPDRQRELLNAVRMHPEWTPRAAELITQWSTDAESIIRNERALLGLLKTYSHRRLIVDCVTEKLSDADAAMQLSLLRLIGEACTRRLPSDWGDEIGGLLKSPDHAIQIQAVLTLKASGSSQFDDELKEIAFSEEAPRRLRVAAIHCFAARAFPLGDEAFALLLDTLTARNTRDEPLLRVDAAFAMRDSHLSESQAITLAASLEKLSQTNGFLVLPALAKLQSAVVGEAFVAGLDHAPALQIVTPDDLTRFLKNFPEDVRDQAAPVAEMLQSRDAPQVAKVAAIVETLNSGDPEAGETVFFSDKAACTVCHRAANRGGGIGPNLSRIAFFRNRNELQSAVLSPNASIAFEFRSWNVRTASGKVAAGYLEQRSSSAIYLRTADKQRVAISVDDIEELELSQRSLMPEGIEKLLTEKELSDLLAFLSRQL